MESVGVSSSEFHSKRLEVTTSNFIGALQCCLRELHGMLSPKPNIAHPPRYVIWQMFDSILASQFLQSLADKTQTLGACVTWWKTSYVALLFC